MRPSATLLSSAAAAAVVSLCGLAYAERTGHLTALDDDPALSQPQRREEASNQPDAMGRTTGTPSAAVANAASLRGRWVGPG